MQQLIKRLTDAGRINEQVEKYTLLVDEAQKSHGALFFIEVDGRTYKVMVPAPVHEAVLKDGAPTAKGLLNHKEAMLLK
ncbi:hypothetical protein [Sphingobacterium sp. MYb382]|uniref:hypothetical protein n=1 Tax=Sphingobacterium sp. MYb382 TaxID=2745278 RepID=UPI0030A5B873